MLQATDTTVSGVVATGVANFTKTWSSKPQLESAAPGISAMDRLSMRHCCAKTCSIDPTRATLIHEADVQISLKLSARMKINRA